MKKFVITLPESKDRQDHFLNVNCELRDWEFYEGVCGNTLCFSDIPVPIDSTWRDPNKFKKPVHKGEIGTTLSHWQLWQKCVDLNETIMIIEDDAIFSKIYFLDKLEEKMVKYGIDLMYLNHNEQRGSNECESLGRHEMVVPIYPYNLTAYCISPSVAEHLLLHMSHIIPVDEFLPNQIATKKFSTTAFKENIVNPSGNFNQTSYDTNPQYFAQAFDIHILTYGTDKTSCARLYDSAAECGVRVMNIGERSLWCGGDMASGPGGGLKINAVKNYLDQNLGSCVSDDAIILFTDAYDVIYLDNMDSIISKFFNMKTDLVFAAESQIWPTPALAPLFGEGSYPYLNSGGYIGYAGALRQTFNRYISDASDDQEYCQLRYLDQAETDVNIKLDTESNIFQCYEPNELVLRDGVWKNLKTGNHYSIYHGNGGAVVKTDFNDIYKKTYGDLYDIHIPKFKGLEVLDDDIIVVNFLTPSACDDIIAKLKSGTWKVLPDDKYSGIEMRLQEIGILDEIKNLWNQHIEPMIWSYWKTNTGGIRDAFVIKYGMEDQIKLDLHNDISLITGSIKLNDEYDGAELQFPRQKISNKEVPIGKCMLFPGQVSHRHKCTDLQDGIKYSMTIWTSGTPTTT